MKIFTFDTTLRDGTQGEAVSFSVDDKLLIAQKLDELGIDYIEGGWPGSNPKDKEFFSRRRRTEAQARQADGLRLHALRQESRGGRPQRARPGGGRHAGGLHLRQDLGPAREARARHHRDENLVLISETVKYLKDHGKEVVYDAEHFFDGYIANPDLRPADAGGRQAGRRRRAVSLRYQRRHAHRAPGRDSSPKSASASTA